MASVKTLGLCSFFLFGLFLSCSERTSPQGKPVAQVNDFVISEVDFRRELADSARYHNIVGLTPADKNECLKGRIQKELLIQAAVSQGLDREDDFRQTMEKFWEQTLITNLLRKEAVRLEKEILVTMEEVEDQYKEMVRRDPGCPPLDQLVQTIENNIREMKKKKALDAWVDRLWKSARITIHEENLKALH
jgi:hypothetical protein